MLENLLLVNEALLLHQQNMKILSYPYIVEIPAYIFDVHSSVKSDPAPPHETSLWLWVLKCYSHETRISPTHLKQTNTNL